MKVETRVRARPTETLVALFSGDCGSCPPAFSGRCFTKLEADRLAFLTFRSPVETRSFRGNRRNNDGNSVWTLCVRLVRSGY
jgi:hypothetical protein